MSMIRRRVPVEYRRIRTPLVNGLRPCSLAPSRCVEPRRSLMSDVLGEFAEARRLRR